MASVTNRSWVQAKSMCEPRVYTSVVVCEGLVYVVGGCDKTGQPIHTLEVYDTSSDVWTSLRNMPTKRAAPIVATIGNKIIAIGGIGIDQRPVDVVEIYFPEENKWKRLQPLSEALMGMGHLIRDNSIHVFGGMGADTNPRDHFKCLEVEGGSKERWQAFQPMPSPRYACSAFLKDNKAYVIGGRRGKLPVANFEVYAYDTKSWTVYPDMLTKRLFPCYVMTDNFMVSLGGLKETVQQGFSDACEVYQVRDQENGEWFTTKKMNMPTKRGDFTAVTIDNRVVVTGGLGNQGGPVSSTESFDPETKKWKRLSDMPMGVGTCSSTLYKGDLYVFGGIAADGPTAACCAFKST